MFLTCPQKSRHRKLFGATPVGIAVTEPLFVEPDGGLEMVAATTPEFRQRGDPHAVASESFHRGRRTVRVREPDCEGKQDG
jgi:hypothetical protein